MVRKNRCIGVVCDRWFEGICLHTLRAPSSPVVATWGLLGE